MSDADTEAMDRRDAAAAKGCVVCSLCGGDGCVDDDPEVRGSVIECPKCKGETWIDAQGRPYKID